VDELADGFAPAYAKVGKRSHEPAPAKLVLEALCGPQIS
jgi:hypothetical protein